MGDYYAKVAEFYRWLETVIKEKGKTDINAISYVAGRNWGFSMLKVKKRLKELEEIKYIKIDGNNIIWIK